MISLTILMCSMVVLCLLVVLSIERQSFACLACCVLQDSAVHAGHAGHVRTALRMLGMLSNE